MPRAVQPFTPTREIADYRTQPERVGPLGVVTPEVAEFCQSGVNVIYAVRDPFHGPLSGLAFAARITNSGHVRIIANRRGHERLFLALIRDSRIAATFTRPADHRSVQLKGCSAVMGAATDADLKATARQTRLFRESIIDVGVDADVSSAFSAYDQKDLVVIEFVPTAVFAQTPGPGAGTELKP